MFKFNFSENHDETNEKLEEISKNILEAKPEVLKECEVIKITIDQYKEIAENVKTAKLNCFVSNDIEIGFLNSSLLTDKSDTDLIPRVYEGGFKIWECTQDLADLLTASDETIEFEGKSVCDLGCSGGMLGIIGLINGASKVDFQDYNEDVLDKFTIPNVVLSCEEQEKPENFSKCAFYSGDWDNFRDMTSDQEKYDIILTSETIYNPENYLKLINFFKMRLKSDGKVYLSAKSYYFGVSGNVLDFCKLLENDGNLAYENVWKSIDGVKREILLIKFKKN